MLPPEVLCFLSFFFQFATSFLSAVCLGRQALWLVFVVRWLFVPPANVLAYQGWLLISFISNSLIKES
jgi:hypothetical protein